MASRKTLQRRRHMKDLRELAALNSHLIVPSEVSAFADRIVNLTKLSPELVRESVAKEPPPHISYVRVFDPGDAEPFLQCASNMGNAVCLVSLVCGIRMRLKDAGQTLRSARVRPMTYPGSVDLEIQSVISKPHTS